MTVESIIASSKSALKKHFIETAETDAAFIIAEILGIRKGALSFRLTEPVPNTLERKINKAILKRCRNMPVAYILGYKDFFMDRFLVSQGTLIPRADTEHLLYVIQESGRKFKHVLDVGTGSGAIALSVARLLPDADITAIDTVTAAALRNKKMLQIQNVTVNRANFFRFKPKSKFDLILSNPPYLSKEDLSLLGKDAALFEPKRAFVGGPDGLSFYRALAQFALLYLESGGWLVLEVDHKWQAVEQILLKQGLTVLEVRKDYNGLERVITAAKP